MTSEMAGPSLVCPGCGSPDVDLEQGLLCGSCWEIVAQETAPAPGACLCSHLRGSHEVRSFNGERHGPCILRACGCGRYRPDPRGETGQQQEARTA